MAKVKVKSGKGINAKKFISPFKNYWNKTNYFILGIGLLFVVLGFILMNQGPWNNPVSLSYSPIVLLIAYLIIFPISILFSKNKTTHDVPSKD